MAAANTDKFKKLTNNFATTLSSPIVGVGDTSTSLASVTNLPTDTGLVLVIDRVDSSGTKTPTKREYVVGTVSGSTVINLVRGVGNSTAQAHLSGAVVEQVVDQRTINDIVDGILAQHNQDGTHGAITATSVVSAGLVTGTTLTGTSLVNTGDSQLRGTSLETIANERMFDHVASGVIITADNVGVNKNYSISSGVVYLNGKRLTVASVAAQTVVASKDRYVDLHDNADGTAVYVTTEVANNAASPALTAGNMRVGIVVAGTTTIATTGSINQGQPTAVLPIASSVPYVTTDSLGNLINPRDSSRKTLGYTETTTGASTASVSLVNPSAPVQITIIPPANCFKIKLSAVLPVSSDTGGMNMTLAITDAANNIVVQYPWASIDANSAHLGSATFSRVIPSTPGSAITYKIRFASNGTAVVQMNGGGTAGPETLLAERA